MSPRRRGDAGLGRTGPRVPEHRVGNRTFYVVAEGERTEYDYFGRLNVAYSPERKALSHPSFNLWLLLHFQNFPLAAQHGKNRLISGGNLRAPVGYYEPR